MNAEPRQSLGRQMEKIAHRHLEGLDYKALEANYRSKVGEKT